MNKIIEWFTIKKFLVFSFLFSLGAIFLANQALSDACYFPSKTCESIILYLIVFFPILLFSLFFLLKHSNPSYWIKFTLIYLVMYLVILLILPFKCDVYLPLCKESVAKILTVGYGIISLILIVYKSLKKE